jgi:2-polyprenyl-3-methyl-5-hydroxy-6-metoxy-1,4-benzoquinol methylase
MDAILITEDYRELNRELHKRVKHYGTFGHEWRDRLMDLAWEVKADTVLDYGCGKGTLKPAVPLTVYEYDPAIRGKDCDPPEADIVICTDVLEHVEVECMDAVLSHIVSKARKAVLLCASTKHGNKKLADGRQAHITVRPPEWWREAFARHGGFTEVPGLRPDEYAAVLKL